MINRRSSGTVLAFIAVSLIILIILGIGLYFTITQLGGRREVTNATDAGSLQVGRDALTISVPMTAAERLRLQGLGDSRNGDQIDLLSFNKLVGMALLIQMNAAADGTVAARTNANAISALVQGPGSVADRLKTRLNTGNVFNVSFTSAFSRNSKRMTGQQNGAYVAGQHQVAYVGRNEASNLDVTRLQDINSTPVMDFATQQAIVLPQTQTVLKAGRRYLAGYTQIPAPGAFRPLVAAAVGPSQASLISATNFDTNTAFLPAATVVPPNAFKSGASIVDQHNMTNTSVAHSRTGIAIALLLEGARRAMPASATTFNPEIPRGYLTIYNNGQVMDQNSGVLSAVPNGGNTLNFFGRVVNPTDNVAAQQLGVGVDLDHDTGFFGLRNSGQVAAWKYHDVHQAGFPRPRSIIDPPHYLSLPVPTGQNNPVWENVLLRDSHRDFCWRAYRGTSAPCTTFVDFVDPLFLEELYGRIPAYNQLFDPRNASNPLMGLWSNPVARVAGGARVCGDGSIQPTAVVDSVTAHWVPYNNLGGQIEPLFDTNISSASPLARAMLGTHQLDNAYFGCSLWSYGRPGVIGNVTAAEAVKLAVFDAYGDGPSPGEPTCYPVQRNFTSGLRQYPRDPGTGAEVPYGVAAHANNWSVPGQRGVVSQPGSLRQLFDQVAPGSGDRLQTFMLSRMRQIRSDATAADAVAMMNQPVEMSSAPYYLYHNGVTFVLTQTAPPAATSIAIPNNIDGRVFQFTRNYNLLDTMVNPRNDNDIHEKLFMTVLTNVAGGPPTSTATEVAQFATSTGYNLELGKIAVRQDANADLQMCDRN